MEEWPAAGCFFSESQTPTTPPVIESWSSSSSNDDDSHVANASASTSSKKPKKRKIHSRLQTKLNFDECVVTQHKNQQWVTPKVTKIIRQCLDGVEVNVSNEQRENTPDLKEPFECVFLAGRTEEVKNSHTETSSSSMGYVALSPGQSSVQDLLKQTLHLNSAKSCTFGMSDEPSSSSGCLGLVTPEKVSSNGSNIVMSSSQESDFNNVKRIEKSDIFGSNIDSINEPESCTTQSSPIIKLHKISRLKRKRNKILSSPIIGRNNKSAEKYLSKQLNIEKTGATTMLSNCVSNTQVSPKNFESNSSRSQEENVQLSPVILCLGNRMKKLDKSVGDTSHAAAPAEKLPKVKSKHTRKPFGIMAIDSHTSESDFDSIIENTQLSPIIKSIRRNTSKRVKSVPSLFLVNSVAESPILTCSLLIDRETSPLINRQSKQQKSNASKMSHSSPYTPTNKVNSPLLYHTDELSKRSLCESPKSPIIKLSSSKKTRKNNLKKVQKKLVDSFLVSETSSETDALSSLFGIKSLEQVLQENNSANSQSDFIADTQLCPTVFTKRKSTGKETGSRLDKSVLKDHSAINSQDPITSTESLTLFTSGLPIGYEVSAENEIPIVAPFKDFLMPLPVSTADTQNTSDYNISVDVDTQNLASPFTNSHIQLAKNSSNLFLTDSSPLNISCSTQDSMDLIVNSLLAKKGIVPDCLDAEAITIDSFSSQDTSSEARVTLPAKITTVSDLPSPKSSGYQIATCSSQTTDQTSPVRNEEPCVYVDSAKKKKRLRKGGYAARLQNLLNRKKSASRIFQHEMLNDAEKFISKGTRLCIDLMWHEYDKVFLQCKYLDQESKEETALLIMDPNHCKKILTNCIITIYPPWHTLTMPRNSAKVITDVFNFQVIAAEDERQLSPASTTAVIQEFNCKCSESLVNSTKCAFKLPRNGLEIFEVLFPAPVLLDVLLGKTINFTASDGTISELLALPSGVSDKHIDICIQRVFCFYDVDKREICWSLLGQDSKGELSEVTLPAKRGGIKTDYDSIVVGDVYRVSVVNVMRRIHRNKYPGLWAVVDCKNLSVDLPSTSDLVALTDNEFNLKKLYIYAITATSYQENVKKLDSGFNWARHSWMKPKVCNLFGVINMQPSDSYSAFSFRVKILLVTENFLYVTDLSLYHTARSYCTVALRPSFVVPANLASKKCGLAFLQDVQLLKGQLSLDRYSRIETAIDQWPAEVLRILLGEKIVFGDLVAATSAAKDLVSVSGKIMGVDEETAFEWLACVECSGNVVAVTPDGSNLCNVCNKTVLSRPMMSLEILVLVGEIFVKIKLQQSTIVLLLPPSQNDGEGFELGRVLGKQIGSIDCLVLQSVSDKEFSFILKELPSI